MPCFDLSGFTPINQSLKNKYRNAWEVFETVQAYDIKVSTLHSGGDTSKKYWQFVNFDEKSNWRIGLSLHAARYPMSNGDPPQKN